MPVDHDLYGETRPVPLTDERGWGDTVTGILGDGIDGLDSTTFLQTSGVAVLKPESNVATPNSLAAGATLTVTHPAHYVVGSGGAVTLSAVTAIADGAVADQELEIFGTDDTNTVEIPTGANTLLNGPVTLRSMDCIRLKWNATGSVWREVSRSN